MKYLEEIKSYWNKRAEGYSISNRESLESNDKEEYEKFLRKYIPKNKKCKTIDMGCGPGFLAILLADMGYESFAFDCTENMLAKAEENARDLGVKIHTIQGDAQNPDIEDKSFDLLVSRNVIWNLENPEKAYKEWIRILKPGGRIIILDGNHYCYLFDDKYMEERKSSTHINDHKNMMGVDTSPIDKIAYDLPLSNKIRPEWDKNILESLGVKIIDIDIDEISYKNEKNEEVKLIKSFKIIGEL
ncbi:class I SAM-dependent methyltransferase [Clostridium sp. NSJ-6]|uniref:Class I SAM-dependent methyltransferase n=1 Tax=Clostridium hominis TaxID=2763036 RepID=A0ABR7DGH3_9CLOT|nr:class I SAM-dependent methyltransferase [Clostridium hominis]MBC5630448.1 class I SAM-dependent methyltransferase [Clostridium hominis]MDU2670835.1 class I SAM-dependent methyltransferase [Clostridium sp.]